MITSEILSNIYMILRNYFRSTIQDDDSLTMGIDEVDTFIQDDGHIVLRNLLLI